MTEIETRTLEVPGGTLQYDVRAAEGSGHPALLMVGFPMDATGFTTLAGAFGDRTVVTYDPRTVGRSGKADPERALTPDDHAEDLAALIGTLGAEPVDVFGSSGGAVNALALVTRHPGQVRTLVAHEPPIAEVLPDRDVVLAACADIDAAYRSGGSGPAMARFIQLVMVTGPLPADYLEQPAPDPATFGMPAGDDGTRDDPMFAGSIRTIPQYRPDLDALASFAPRLVVAAGEESVEAMPGRAAVALAGRLGMEVTMFPSHHGGFLAGEFGQQGDPERFAARLHQVLDAG